MKPKKRCIEKLMDVCKNRQCSDIGEMILSNIAPKFFSKAELAALIENFNIPPVFQSALKSPKPQKDYSKLKQPFFSTQLKFGGQCTGCFKEVEKDKPGFLSGKSIYHVVCAIEKLGIPASYNPFYQKWANVPTASDIASFDHETKD